MKILSDEEIHKIPHTEYLIEGDCEPGGTCGEFGYEDYVPLLEAQHKDTLRQVRELLDGVECPYGRWHSSERAWGFADAIQTIKALLEE